MPPKFPDDDTLQNEKKIGMGDGIALFLWSNAFGGG